MKHLFAVLTLFACSIPALAQENGKIDQVKESKSIASAQQAAIDQHNQKMAKMQAERAEMIAKQQAEIERHNKKLAEMQAKQLAKQQAAIEKHNKKLAKAHAEREAKIVELRSQLMELETERASSHQGSGSAAKNSVGQGSSTSNPISTIQTPASQGSTSQNAVVQESVQTPVAQGSTSREPSPIVYPEPAHQLVQQQQLVEPLPVVHSAPVFQAAPVYSAPSVSPVLAPIYNPQFAVPVPTRGGCLSGKCNLHRR